MSVFLIFVVLIVLAGAGWGARVWHRRQRDTAPKFQRKPWDVDGSDRLDRLRNLERRKREDELAARR